MEAIVVLDVSVELPVRKNTSCVPKLKFLILIKISVSSLCSKTVWLCFKWGGGGQEENDFIRVAVEEIAVTFPVLLIACIKY